MKEISFSPEFAHQERKQLEELSPKAREKLHQYLGIKVTSALEWPEKYFETALLNIGEMIEYLDKINTSNLGPGPDWQDVCINFPADKLCDGLWKVIKEVLEQK